MAWWASLFLSLFHRHHYFNPPNCILYRGDVIFKYFYFAKSFYSLVLLQSDHRMCFVGLLLLLLIDLNLTPLRLYTRGCVCVFAVMKKSLRVTNFNFFIFFYSCRISGSFLTHKFHPESESAIKSFISRIPKYTLHAVTLLLGWFTLDIQY